MFLTEHSNANVILLLLVNRYKLSFRTLTWDFEGKKKNIPKNNLERANSIRQQLLLFYKH